MESATRIRAAFQGEPGAYSEAAVLEHLGPQAETRPCESFEQVFDAVTAGQADLGLLPIENSLAGSIHRNYDLLLQHDLHVVGEHYLRIHHCLIALPGARLGQLRRVISHPQALAQCEGSLRRLGLVSEAVYDTAGSVKLLKALGDPGLAAVASRRAAEIYGLPILQENIEDHPANFTRFLAVAARPVTPDGDAKTSIVFALKNEPGSLFKALSVFALRDIDLSKIESRPLASLPWNYLFYVDFLGAAHLDPCRRALDHLAEYATQLRWLGSYPRHRAERLLPRAQNLSTGGKRISE